VPLLNIDQYPDEPRDLLCEPHFVTVQSTTRHAVLLLFPTLITLSGVGTCFHVVVKIRHIFLRPTASWTSTRLETELNTSDFQS
jgi:hypothetical protein